jgi:hypothetical protein
MRTPGPPWLRIARSLSRLPTRRPPEAQGRAHMVALFQFGFWHPTTTNWQYVCSAMFLSFFEFGLYVLLPVKVQAGFTLRNKRASARARNYEVPIRERIPSDHILGS